ncbi:MAG: TIR domain-containing protein [Marinomonas sp.]
MLFTFLRDSSVGKAAGGAASATRGRLSPPSYCMRARLLYHPRQLVAGKSGHSGEIGMVDVFISYSRKDKERVARLARAIEDEGYDVWWDAELPPHQSYGDVITRKISEAKAAIVVWSPDAAASEWVRAEADMARNQKKLVQTALGEIIPPLPFNQIQYADIGDWEGEDTHDSWRKVKASLADLCGRDGPDESVASAHEPAFAPEPEEPATELEAPVVYEEYEEPAASKVPLFAGLGIGAVLLAVGAAFAFSPDVSDYESENDGEAIASIGGGGADTPVTASPAPDAPAPEAQRPEIPADWILATVDDPDGHSNVRARPSISSDIVSQVQVGETFRARRESGNWWPVELSDGTKGFIAKRLIRVKGSADSAPPEDETPAPPQARRVTCSFDNTAFSFNGPCDFTSGSDGDFTASSVNGPFFTDVTRVGLDVTAPEQGTLQLFSASGQMQPIDVTRSTVDSACWEGPSVSFCAR